MGKHRAPNVAARRAASVAVLTATVGIAMTGGFAPVASAQTLPPDAIAECESGGSITAQNPSSTASGKWQIINGTWAAYGGTEFAPTAKQATEREQDIVAARIYADSGTQPWVSSKGCWGDEAQTSSNVAPAPKAPAPRKVTLPEPEVSASLILPEPVKVDTEVNVTTPVVPKVTIPENARFTPGGDGFYTVQDGDTLSKLALDYKLSVDTIGAKNADIVEHDDWIFVGEKLTLTP